jgi:hypothetical protein
VDSMRYILVVPCHTVLVSGGMCLAVFFVQHKATQAGLCAAEASRWPATKVAASLTATATLTFQLELCTYITKYMELGTSAASSLTTAAA